ncbi:hypothetical protein OIE67_44105 [Nonomuraea fuscirosea]|uniref:HAD family hydrolase n=1 Tax=Nonomuraea fuscirosea TaxID=1291556 RepID=UPI002DDA5CCE|nr:HAD family hydrolase [Nonomuraea fuscirosea]WSA50974.1 hypothetical protein OIE67_44105 [Nonomuraea fuscirosea]
MAITVEVPGRPALVLEHLICDVNGTLTARGELIDGVAVRIDRLRALLVVHLASADTFATLPMIAERLGVNAIRVETGADKADLVRRLDPQACVVVGNGVNDRQALEAAVLGMAVIGPEGASTRALAAADVVCATITDALELLLDPRGLTATLRP